MKNPEKKAADECYLVMNIGMGAAAAGLLAARLLQIDLSRLFLPCLFHLVTGLYCPGCGGTRAVTALLHLHVLQSFRCHPLVLYGAALAGVFWVRKTLELMTGGRIPGMRMRAGYLYLGVALVFVQWIVKNVLLIFWGIGIETVL